MRIVFMGTPRFAVPSLEALRAAGHEIIAVCTQPDRPAGRSGRPAAPPVKILAGELRCEVLQPAGLGDGDLAARLREMRPDLLAVVAYGLKLPGWLLGLPRLGAVNLHPSLLPRYRGAAPVNWALINGEEETGVTTMHLAERMDAGDIILQQRVAVLPDENAGQLETRLSSLGADLLARTAAMIAEGTAPRTPQDEALATAAPKLVPDHGRIEWTRPARRIRDLVRGVTPKPGAFTLFRGQRLEIAKVEPAAPFLPRDAAGGAGEIIGLDTSRGPVVGTGDGALVLRAVKPAGRREMDGAAFLNGYRPAVGEPVG
ncbi:MAG: methionyl-tRNA formyltransferase [Candidatus Edwardsbacteria bacterium]|jgi:methionyl-tRNA formyltransferase|nr:methionyl-tRNA formyltransferase [Candidatus Edwardsbacteria bacterium]